MLLAVNQLLWLLCAFKAKNGTKSPFQTNPYEVRANFLKIQAYQTTEKERKKEIRINNNVDMWIT